MNAGEFVRKAVKGNNFMTPDIIDYGFIDENTAYELSEGRGFDSKPIYGVTVCKHENGRFWNAHDLRKLCYSRSEANEYITHLKEAKS